MQPPLRFKSAETRHRSAINPSAHALLSLAPRAAQDKLIERYYKRNPNARFVPIKCVRLAFACA